MNPNPEMMTPTYSPSRAELSKPKPEKSRKKRLLKAALFILLWAGLIGAGVYGMHVYMNQLIENLQADLAAQTEERMQQLEQNYTEHLEQLKQTVNTELGYLQSEVETFNEMLTFTEDLAGDRTDESNQLYTRLEQLEEHLQQLSENLEVLR